MERAGHHTCVQHLLRQQGSPSLCYYKHLVYNFLFVLHCGWNENHGADLVSVSKTKWISNRGGKTFSNLWFAACFWMVTYKHLPNWPQHQAHNRDFKYLLLFNGLLVYFSSSSLLLRKRVMVFEFCGKALEVQMISTLTLVIRFWHSSETNEKTTVCDIGIAKQANNGGRHRRKTTFLYKPLRLSV